MAAVYILYSDHARKYYIGSCQNVPERLSQHLIQYFPKAYTSQAKDWVIYFQIDHLTYSQARKIERHIKRMKSKKFIEDLTRYPAIVERLKRLYYEG